MVIYPKRHRPRKQYRLACCQLDLFAWATAQTAPVPFPETLAIRSIVRRFGVTVHLARAIAENANMGGEA